LDEEHLKEANQLKDMSIPPKTLVIMVKRNDKFLVPNGTMVLLPGDRLLMISEDDEHQLILIE
jgi:cell volume regulation protein A